MYANDCTQTHTHTHMPANCVIMCATPSRHIRVRARFLARQLGPTAAAGIPEDVCAHVHGAAIIAGVHGARCHVKIKSPVCARVCVFVCMCVQFASTVQLSEYECYAGHVLAASTFYIIRRRGMHFMCHVAWRGDRVHVLPFAVAVGRTRAFCSATLLSAASLADDGAHGGAPVGRTGRVRSPGIAVPSANIINITLHINRVLRVGSTAQSTEMLAWVWHRGADRSNTRARTKSICVNCIDQCVAVIDCVFVFVARICKRLRQPAPAHARQ